MIIDYTYNVMQERTIAAKVAASKVKYLVEIVGTFILVYACCSAGTVYSEPNNLEGIVGLDRLSMIAIGLVAAFVVIAITYATAYRSGAQINPAVTIALLVTRKFVQKKQHCILRDKY